MMESLFPRVLVACIGEGRLPNPQELLTMADKVHREAFPNHRSLDERRHAMNIARAALSGQPVAA